MRLEEIEEIARTPNASREQIEEAIRSCKQIIEEYHEMAFYMRRDGYREEDVEIYAPHSTASALVKLEQMLAAR